MNKEALPCSSADSGMGTSLSFAEALARSGRIAYTVVGVSMRPLIREGRDAVVIEQRSPEEIRQYDAVLFRRPGIKGRGEYVLHRVLARHADGRFWIVGDNCVSGEDVAPENVLGVMTALNRGGKDVRLTGNAYRAYVRLWCAPWRLRFALLRILHLFRRTAGFIKRNLR